MPEGRLQRTREAYPPRAFGCAPIRPGDPWMGILYGDRITYNERGFDAFVALVPDRFKPQPEPPREPSDEDLWGV